MRRSLLLIIFGWLFLISDFATKVHAGFLPEGTILVTDTVSDSVFQVDPLSGERAILTSNTFGSGPEFGASSPFFSGGPRGVAVNRSGQIFVVNNGLDANAIYQVDPMTGDRTIVTSSSVGVGPDFTSPSGLTIGPDGNLYVTDTIGGAVFRVDALTGDRSLVSGGDVITGEVGGGVDLFSPLGIAFETGGTIVVTDTTLDSVIRIDPSSGDRSVVASDSTGNGPNLGDPSGITVGRNGDLFVADTAFDAIRHIAPDTGDRTTVANFSNGSGENFISISGGITTDLMGDILFSETFFDSIFQIDAETLARTVTTGESFSPKVGTGPDLSAPFMLAVVPEMTTVPEPSSFLLFGLGAFMAACVIIVRWSNRSRLV